MYNKRVLIVIINYKLWNKTIDCLKSLKFSDYKNYSIVLIDNASNNESILRLKEFFIKEKFNFEEFNYNLELDMIENLRKPLNKEIFFIKSNENLGFSGGVNIGIKVADIYDFDYIYLLNNDAIINNDTLYNLVKTAEDYKVPIVGSVIYDTNHNLLFKGAKFIPLLFGIRRYSLLEDENCYISDEANGSSMLISIEAVRRSLKIRKFYFDSIYFLYCEETDFCKFCIEEFNKKILISKKSIIFHDTSSSSGGKFNPRTFYYLTRNRIILANRYLSFNMKILFHLYYIPSRLLLQIKYFFKDFKFNRILAVIDGLKDGYLKHYGKWKKHDYF